MMPSKENIDFMKDLFSKLNSVDENRTTSSGSHKHNNVKPNINHNTGGSSYSDMIEENKVLLEKLYSIGSSPSKPMCDSSEFREAIVTEKIDSGARIGSWEIHVNTSNSNNKTIKTYDIINIHTQEPIAKDLFLYEVAHGLVRLFNRGETLTSKKVSEILMLEEKYTRNRLDAISFKRKYNIAIKERNVAKMDLMESRYQKAKDEALSAKHSIKEICKEI